MKEKMEEGWGRGSGAWQEDGDVRRERVHTCILYIVRQFTRNPWRPPCHHFKHTINVLLSVFWKLLQFVIASSHRTHQPANKNAESFGFYFDQLYIFTRSLSLSLFFVSSIRIFSYSGYTISSKKK